MNFGRMCECFGQTARRSLVMALILGMRFFQPSPVQAQVANPVISRNLPAFASSNQSAATLANDDSFSTEWRSSGQPAWIAYDLSSVPAAQRQQVLVAWHNNSGGYYDFSVIASSSYNVPGPYVIEGNAAAGGQSGAPNSGWVTLFTSPTPQNYRNNQHYLSNFGSYNWIRFRTTAGNPNNDGMNVDVGINLDVHDAHPVLQDSWMFYGDSITANCWRPGAFTTLINAAKSQHFPAASNGGIPFLTASDAVPLFARWLPLFPGRYVGIAYGTNDANGVPPATFYEKTKNLADMVLAAGKVPVIPTIPWASASQRNDSAVRALNGQIARLKLEYGGRILDGPDLYTAFLNRSDLLGDGLHPNEAGNTVMQQAWANKMLTVLYDVAPTPPPAAPTSLRVIR